MRFLLPLFVLSFFSLNTLSFAKSGEKEKYFNVGVMFSMQQKNIPAKSILNFAAIVLAFEDLNNKTDGVYDDILPDIELRPVVRYPNNAFYDGAYAAKDMMKADNNTGVKVNIGPYGSLATQGAAPTFKELGKIPLIGYYERSSILSHSLVYSNVLRPVPPMYYDALAIAHLISEYFLWEKVTVFSDNSEDGVASSILFHHHASSLGINILSSHAVEEFETDYSAEILEAKKIGARVFVLFLAASDGSRLIDQGYRLKLFKDGIQIIGGEPLSLGSAWQSAGVDLESFSPLLKGFIGVKYRPYAPPSEMKSRFLQRWVNHKPTNGFVNENGELVCDNTTDYYGDSYLYQFYPGDDQSKSPLCAGVNFTSYNSHLDLDTELDELMYAYDATITAALALHHMVSDMKIADPSPAQLMQYLLHNTSFIGLTEKVTFMSDMKDFNLGGRDSSIFYDVVNFVSPADLAASGDSSRAQVGWSEVFPTVMSWHSENGFPSCGGVSGFVKENPCVTFHFNTEKNSLPLDSPPPTIETMSFPLVSFLRVFSSLGIFFVVALVSVTYLFRTRRLVRMSQPIMTYFTLSGVLIAYAAMILTAHTTEDTCVARLWLKHLGFQLIFTTLLIRSWRVYLVAGTMKRTKVSDVKSALFIGASLLVTTVLLLAGTIGSVGVKYVTVTDNQFEHILQPACSYDQHLVVTLLYAFDALIFLAALRYCWMIRNVSSTICNTATLVEALVTTLLVIVVTVAIIIGVHLDPLTREFVTSLMIGVLVTRLLWIFEAQLVLNLMLGYELDRALILRKTELSLLDMTFNIGHLSSGKIFIAAPEKVDSPTHSATTTRRGDAPAAVDDELMAKGLAKYGKLKHKAELDAEIERVKAEIKHRQVELACLENMIFASEHDSKSQSQSGRRSSHGQSGQPPAGSRHSQVESGHSRRGDSKNEGEEESGTGRVRGFDGNV